MSEGVASIGNAALFAAARTGDEGAWPDLVRRYDGLIRAVVSQFSMNSADSGDAAQNTWLRLFERADTVREPEKLGAWLAHDGLGVQRLAIVQRRVEYPKATEDLDCPSPDPTPEAAVIAAEMRVHVRAATDALPGRPRALIDALYYRRGSYAEVGTTTGMPIGSIGLDPHPRTAPPAPHARRLGRVAPGRASGVADLGADAGGGAGKRPQLLVRAEPGEGLEAAVGGEGRPVPGRCVRAPCGCGPRSRRRTRCRACGCR